MRFDCVHVARDLPGVVDRSGAALAFIWAQVPHRTVLPQKGMRSPRGGRARPDDLPGAVDGAGSALLAPEGAQVVQHSILPEKGVLCLLS